MFLHWLRSKYNTKQTKMNQNYIKMLREKNRLTQEYLADEIGVSRPTYLLIEQGGRDLTVKEAQKLAEIFGLTLDDFLAGKNPRITIKVTNKGNQPAESTAIRIDVPQKNLKKFKEVLLYVLARVGGKPNVGESVLNKLFYFIDFDYYEKYEEQLIGATYIRNHFGPTPVELVKIVDEMIKKGEVEEVKSKFFKFDQKKYLPHRKPDLSLFSAREIGHIDDVLCRLSDKTAAEIGDYSHGDIPWLTKKDGEVMEYESVFYRDEKYSVRNYDDEL
jgi:transcriptional regulator with XRE-family HTH domain